MAVYHSAPTDAYEDEVAAREELLEGFAPPGDTGAANGDVGSAEREDLESYERPQYGYALEYDAAQWHVTAEDDDRTIRTTA